MLISRDRVLGLAHNRGSLKRWPLGQQGSEWELAKRNDGGVGSVGKEAEEFDQAQLNLQVTLLEKNNKNKTKKPSDGALLSLTSVHRASPQIHQLWSKRGRPGKQKWAESILLRYWREQAFEESY